MTTAFVARALDASSDDRSKPGRSRVVPAAVQLVLRVQHGVDELAQRVVRRGGCLKRTRRAGGESVGHFRTRVGRRLGERRVDATLANVALERNRGIAESRYVHEPLRGRAARLHLPPTSKPNKSNRPCVATSMRLLRSFRGGRALRSARRCEASAAAFAGAARASTFGIASARIITASMPMRRSRRNIEKKGGALVGQSVPVSCFSTVRPASGGRCRFRPQTVTRVTEAHTRSRSRASTSRHPT